MSKRPQRPDVEPGDEVYVRHPQHGPMAVKVVAHGKDGMTARCDRGKSHQLHWDAYLGHKTRMTQRMRIIDQGADGALLEDDKGCRRFVTGALPDTTDAPVPTVPGRDDPLLGGLDRLQKSMTNEATMIPDTRILFLKAAPIAQRAGLALKDVTDKAGHQTKRWTRTVQEEPANDKGPTPMKHGDVVPFRHGDVQGEGKIVASGTDGVTLQDHTGREHQVRHEHLLSPSAGDAGDATPDKQDKAADNNVEAKPSAGGGGDGGGDGTIPPDKFTAADYFTKTNDPNATVDDILKGFPADTAEKIADVQKRIAALPETIKQHKVNGRWTEERRALHGKIFEHFLNQAAVEAATPGDGQSPTFTVLGGRGGSGKSWFKGKVYDPKKVIVLDADEIKGMLPEYQGWNAFQVHEESGELFDEITLAAMDLGLNIVHDATMKTKEKAVKNVKGFQAAGYRVEAHYMHLPRQEAAKRAIERFLGPTGRFVPPEVVLGNTGNEASFDAVKSLVDVWSFRDNNVDKGQPPKLISEMGNDQADAGADGEDGLDGQPPAGQPDVDRAPGLAEKDGRGEGLQKALPAGGRIIFFLRKGR